MQFGKIGGVDGRRVGHRRRGGRARGLIRHLMVTVSRRPSGFGGCCSLNTLLAHLGSFRRTRRLFVGTLNVFRGGGSTGTIGLLGCNLNGICCSINGVGRTVGRCGGVSSTGLGTSSCLVLTRDCVGRGGCRRTITCNLATRSLHPRSPRVGRTVKSSLLTLNRFGRTGGCCSLVLGHRPNHTSARFGQKLITVILNRPCRSCLGRSRRLSPSCCTRDRGHVSSVRRFLRGRSNRSG